MASGQVRLGVDAGAATTVAVLLEPAGGRRQFALDGVEQPRGGSRTGPDTSAAGESARQVSSGIGAATPGVVADGSESGEATAAVLRRIAEQVPKQAGVLPDAVVLVVPAGWGPRRRMRLRTTARRAGLGDVVLTDAPVGVAQHLAATGVELPVGSWIGVCDFGVGFEASVVRRGPDGFEVISTIHADAGGGRIDQAVADYLTAQAVATPYPAAQRAGVVDASQDGEGEPTHPLHDGLSPQDRVVVLAAVRAAKHALTSSPAVVVPMPGSRPGVVLTAQDVQRCAQPVLAEAVATARQAIEAAELPMDRCVGVFAVGGGSQLPGVVAALSNGLGTPVRSVEQPKLAAVMGALRAGRVSDAGERGDTAAGGDAVTAPPWRRVFGLLVPGLAAITLFAQFLTSIRVYTTPGNDLLTYMRANWGELGLAGLCVLLACLSTATILASALPGLEPDEQVRAGQETRQISTGLLAAVALGLTLAAGFAVIGSVAHGMQTQAYLRWALLPAIPVAVAGLAAAGLAMWRAAAPQQGWHAWLVFPPGSLLLAGGGMLVLQYALTAPLYPRTALLHTILTRAAAAAIGVGAALAVAGRRRYQIILAAPLGAFAAAIGGVFTTGLLTAGYALAVAVWWGRRLWRLSGLPSLRRPRRAGRQSTGGQPAVGG